MFEKIGIWLDDLEDLVKASDWKKITLATIVPVVVAFIAGGYFFSKKVTVTQTYTTSEVGRLFSTQDLPTQIGNIENNELRVVQGQLADIQAEQEKDENGDPTDFALNFTKLNADTDLNNFFKTLIGIRFDTKVDTAYRSLKPYLASGSVMVSVMSGSTSANRYFQVLVPVTNDKRDFALLNYIVKTNESGKILACTYTGALQGYSDLNTYYKKVADLLNGNTVRDDRGKYSTKENAEDFNHHSTEE